MNKGAEVDKNKFNNKQGLETAMEDSGGWHGWGAITTDDSSAHNILPLNNVVHI
jgi:hypothetical protein